MNVATITFGYSQNLGALLQTYALCDYINSVGHHCEVIKFRDFDNRPFETIKGIWDGFSDIVYFGKCKEKIRKINAYREKFIPYTEKQYNSSEEMSELNDIYDAFIAGSDQIWNVHKGIVKEFFLSFADDRVKKIAYSASFGLSELPEEYKEDVKGYLKRFDSISIREASGIRIAEVLVGKKYPQTLDPVFLKSRKEWEVLCPERKVKEKYIFVYPTQITPELKKTVGRIKKKLNCKVYSLFHFVGVDKVVKDADPIDFINYVRYAEIVVGSSFHATAFAVIFEKNLCVIPHSTTGSRVVDLLSSLNLDQCIVTDDTYELTNTDYTQARALLLQAIQHSKDYIDEVLK